MTASPKLPPDRGELGFLPVRVDRCPECDSEKMVFPKSRGKKNESLGISWRCTDYGCAGFQSGCMVVVTRDGKQLKGGNAVGFGLNK
jgi:hypothetical protein